MNFVAHVIANPFAESVDAPLNSKRQCAAATALRSHLTYFPYFLSLPQNIRQHGDKFGGYQVIPGAEGQGQVDHQRYAFSTQSNHTATDKSDPDLPKFDLESYISNYDGKLIDTTMQSLVADRISQDFCASSASLRSLTPPPSSPQMHSVSPFSRPNKEQTPIYTTT